MGSSSVRKASGQVTGKDVPEILIWQLPGAKADWMGEAVGKLGEFVIPETNASPVESTAKPRPISKPVPPRNVA
jgi:hypothetical protein